MKWWSMLRQNECCGILAGVNGKSVKLYRTTNIEHNPYCFSIDPRELVNIYQEIRENKWNLLGIYHSHTHTNAYPSPADIRSAYLPEAVYLIISLSSPDHAIVKGFYILENKVTEIELKIIEKGDE